MSTLSKNVFFSAVLSLTISASHASPWSDGVRARLDAVIEKNFLNQSQVGMTVGIVNGDETQVLNYGERIKGSNEAPGPNSYFEMGSITKTFTTTLLALEVNRGRIMLTDPVETLWTELAGTDAGRITLEQLATHTSGLGRMPDNFNPSDPLNPYKDYDAPLLLEFLKTFKHESPSPHPYAYSNLGMGLLGHLLASKLNHLSFDSYLQTSLLGPLGLQHTKTALEVGDLNQKAQGYDSFFRLMPFWDFGVLSPAGALKTNINDLIKYMKFNLQPDSSPLGRAAALAQLPRMAVNPNGDQIGLAWFSGRIGNHFVVTHGGATGGYRADLAFDPENKSGIVVLSNTAVSPACIVETFFEAACEVPKWKPLTPTTQARLSGSYYAEEIQMTLTVVIENGYLGLQQEDHRMRLWAKSDSEMHLPEVRAVLQFETETPEQAGRFILLQNGRTITFARK